MGCWAHVLAFSLLPWLSITWVKALSFLPSPCSLLSCVRGPFSWGSYQATLLFLLYHYLSLFYFLLPVCLRADTPTMPVHFPYLYLFWVLLANIQLCQHNSFIGFPRPIHFFFTSFTLMGYLLNCQGFLGPITTSLPLITFRAYWPLSQPNEFTNSFPGLSRPIYFLFTSYCSYELTTSFLRLPRPICFLGPFTSSLPLITLMGLLANIFAISACWAYFTIFSSHFIPQASYPIYFLFTPYYSSGPAGQHFCHSALLGLLYYFLFSLSSYCWVFLLLGPFSKVGINNTKMEGLMVNQAQQT